ncbi:MAG: hypothetical protein IJ050_00005, partial [Clostridia bacterium]|nr:hypothetical protein [Clostridia bacterium]
MKKMKGIPKRLLAVMLAVMVGFGSVSVLGLGDVKASAATAGSYYVRVTFSHNGSVGGFNAGLGEESNDSCGVIVRYKTNNGTGSTNDNNIVKFSGSGNPSSSQQINGFPDLVYLYYDEDRVMGTKKAHLTKLEVSGDNSSWTTLWSGDLQCGSVWNPYAISVDSSGEIKKDWFGTDSDCKMISSSGGWTDKFPTATAMSSGAAISGADTITIPKTDSITSAYTNSGTVKDQYGVDWYQDLIYYLASSEPQSVSDVSDSFSSTQASINGTGTLTLKTAAKIEGITNSVDAWVCAKRGNAWLKKKVTFVDPQYAVEFYDGNGNKFGETQNVYYGDNASNPGTPSKNYDDTYHYTFNSWDDLTNITDDRTVNSNFNPVEHTYGDWSADTATCTEGGEHTKQCTGCAKTITETTAALGHDYQFTRTVAPTCLAQGYDIYTCSRCGATENRNLTAKLSHSYIGEIRNNNDGTHSFKCVNGCNEYGATVSCNYGDWSADTATCLEGGSKSHTCADCGYKETVSTDALG